VEEYAELTWRIGVNTHLETKN